MTPATPPPAITGRTIAAEAVKALSDRAFVATPGSCQMFAREVAEAVGGPVKAEMDAHRAASAAQTLENFRGTPFLVWDRRSGKPMPPIQEGDFLYKGPDTCHYLDGSADEDGHVAVAGNGRRVGLPGSVVIALENSSYHTRIGSEPGRSGAVQGAKGWRTLDAFGPFSGIVRLV